MATIGDGEVDAETALRVCHSRTMDRSLVLKASALARGTRKIPLLVDSEDEGNEAVALDDAIDAEFIELVAPVALVALVVAEPVAPARVTPGRARRATDAYASQPVTPRPVIAIG
jgi:hypothetical protein